MGSEGIVPARPWPIEVRDLPEVIKSEEHGLGSGRVDESDSLGFGWAQSNIGQMSAKSRSRVTPKLIQTCPKVAEKLAKCRPTVAPKSAKSQSKYEPEVNPLPPPKSPMLLHGIPSGQKPVLLEWG